MAWTWPGPTLSVPMVGRDRNGSSGETVHLAKMAEGRCYGRLHVHRCRPEAAFDETGSIAPCAWERTGYFEEKGVGERSCRAGSAPAER